jgi:hypothetical protein
MNDDAMDRAQPSQGGKWLDVGSYDLRITQCISKTVQAGPSSIFVFEILASSREEYPIGSERSHVINMLRPSQEAALGEVKAALFAIAGFRSSQFQEAETVLPKVSAIWRAATGAGNALRGMVVHCECYHKATKPKFPGGPEGKFTMHSYSPMPGTETEQRARMIAIMNGALQAVPQGYGAPPPHYANPQAMTHYQPAPASQTYQPPPVTYGGPPQPPIPTHFAPPGQQALPPGWTWGPDGRPVPSPR